MQFDTRSLWIYLHFPSLQLDLIEVANRSVSEQQALNKVDLPRAIVDVNTNTLCQLNQAAIKEGLRQHMGLASASLHCSKLQLHEYSADIERNHIVNIADNLYLITCDIVVDPPNAIILRAQNMLSLYGSLQEYWQIITQTLKYQGVQCTAASGYSVQMAKLIALNNKHLISSDRLQIEGELKNCLLSFSDIDPKDLQKLARIGIKTYADMCKLPLAELANRVSRFSMSVINELQGKQAAKVKFYQPKANYHDYLELLYEVSLSEKLLPIISLCINKLSQFLHLRNAHCLSISMHFFQREHEPLLQEFNSIRPIYKTFDWMDIISLKLESIAFESPVYAISVLCEKYEVAEIANDDMFSHKSTHLAALTLLSRLQSKLGNKSISRINFVNDFRPEHSTRNEKVDALMNKNNYSQATIFPDRPGLLLCVPQPLQLAVQVIKGPERIQTGWWDDKPVNRDYYIGQSDNGQQVWIFKTPSQKWFLHGYFV